ncbi:uncharacterized protein LOC119337062 isoform X3 [Triticum dicoccoides]|uniref:uncharacterized protein LOC119337062 isoform X3 n=1 Tax=Triticum dicoccoides TaxID=85692 RepID=UPI0018916BF4|nr:uncharacterized protein LOC119337062 isoform X3 [Triticum dicoccoides]
MVDGGSISSWIESCQEAGAWARCTGGCSPPLPCGAADTDISGWVTDRGLSGWATTPAAGAIPMDSGTTRNIQVIEGTSIHITWVAMKDVFPSQVMKMAYLYFLTQVLIGVGIGLYKLGFPAVGFPPSPAYFPSSKSE